jgi:RimJ/RimL family protein N-acetyltransferase
MDARAVAEQVSAITRREPRMLRRSAREIERALREGRAVLRLERDEPVAFLFRFPYGTWHEVGTGYVAPHLRGKGVFTQMHHELLDGLDAPCFGFPANEAVERVMRRCGFARAGYRALPARTWAAFLADHYTPRKLASNVRALADGARRYSTRLYVRSASR